MNDLISRQAAIDVIFSEPLYEPGMKKRSAEEVVPAIFEKVKVLPSAHPEPCEDAVSRQAVINIINKPVIIKAKEQIEALPSVQTEQRWIPVSERLPEEDDYKSCIECLDGAVWYFTENGTMGLGYYYKSTKEWSTTDDLKTDGKVVAWMPLPEPYHEDKQDNS